MACETPVDMPCPGRCPYTHSAATYELFGGVEFSKQMVEFVATVLRDLAVEPLNHVVDVACGVGTACIAFAHMGYDVTGIDFSSRMLEQARRNAHLAGVVVNWLLQDMRRLSVDRQADVVTVMYDSLNCMVTEEDLSAAFAGIARMLRPQGVLVFDMYTLAGLKACWGTECRVKGRSRDHYVVTETTWHSHNDTDEMRMTGFSRCGTLWRRWEEVHILRAYPVARIRQLLADAGIACDGIGDWDRPHHGGAGGETHRAVFIAQKVGCV